MDFWDIVHKTRLHQRADGDVFAGDPRLGGTRRADVDTYGVVARHVGLDVRIAAEAEPGVIEISGVALVAAGGRDFDRSERIRNDRAAGNVHLGRAVEGVDHFAF